MKSAILVESKKPLLVEEIELPEKIKFGQVLVKVHYSGICGAQINEIDRVKVTFEGNVEYVLGNTHITDIEVDGGNRKWIATANAGILLLSPDGSEILEQHTTENSPLVSNNIFDLKLDT